MTGPAQTGGFKQYCHHMEIPRMQLRHMIEICSVTAGEVYSLYSDCTVGEWWTVQLRYQLHHVNNNNTTEATVFPERNKIKCFVNVDMILLYRDIE